MVKSTKCWRIISRQCLSLCSSSTLPMALATNVTYRTVRLVPARSRCRVHRLQNNLQTDMNSSWSRWSFWDWSGGNLILALSNGCILMHPKIILLSHPECWLATRYCKPWKSQRMAVEMHCGPSEGDSCFHLPQISTESLASTQPLQFTPA